MVYCTQDQSIAVVYKKLKYVELDRLFALRIARMAVHTSLRYALSEALCYILSVNTSN